MYEGWIHVITSHGHLMHGCCRIVMKSGMLTAEGFLSGYSVLFFVGLKQPLLYKIVATQNICNNNATQNLKKTRYFMIENKIS